MIFICKFDFTWMSHYFFAWRSDYQIIGLSDILCVRAKAGARNMSPKGNSGQIHSNARKRKNRNGERNFFLFYREMTKECPSKSALLCVSSPVMAVQLTVVGCQGLESDKGPYLPQPNNQSHKRLSPHTLDVNRVTVSLTRMPVTN